MGQSAGEIAEELAQTRAEAANKIERIEQQVTEKTDAVKESLDWRHQVGSRPLLSLGAAFVGGVVLGGMSGGGDEGGSARSSAYAPAGSRAAGGATQGQGGVSGSLRHVMRTSGAEEALSSAAAALLTTATQRVKDVIDETFPGFTERYEHSKATPGGLSDKINAPAGEAPELNIN